MTATDYESDIPLNVACAAHRGTSFDPEKRGEQARSGYARTLAADREMLWELARAKVGAAVETDEGRAEFDAEFNRYRDGYRQRMLAMFHAQSRCVSTMIAGPANFPVTRQRKIGDTADRRAREATEFRERALKAIRGKLNPAERPIMAGDEDAVERLREKSADAETRHGLMLAANEAFKHGGLDAVAALDGLAPYPDLLEYARSSVRLGYGRPFPTFHLTNSNAGKRRVADRIAAVTRAKALPAVEQTSSTGVRLEDDPAANRVRLFYQGKPPAETIAELKRSGFRWTPSLGCWQAYRTARHHAVRLAGLDKPAPVVEAAPLAAGETVRRKIGPHDLVGTIAEVLHGADSKCYRCTRPCAHVTVEWDDCPDELFDEDPADLERLP